MESASSIQFHPQARIDLRTLAERNPRGARRVLRAIEGLKDNAFDGVAMNGGDILSDMGIRKIYCDERPRAEDLHLRALTNQQADRHSTGGANLRVLYRLVRNRNGKLLAYVFAVGFAHYNERAARIYGRDSMTVYEQCTRRVAQPDVRAALTAQPAAVPAGTHRTAVAA